MRGFPEQRLEAGSGLVLSWRGQGWACGLGHFPSHVHALGFPPHPLPAVPTQGAGPRRSSNRLLPPGSVPSSLLRKAWVPVSLHGQLPAGGGFISLIPLEQDHPGKLVPSEKRLHEKAYGAQPPSSLPMNLRLLTSFQPIALHLDLPVLTGLGAPLNLRATSPLEVMWSHGFQPWIWGRCSRLSRWDPRPPGLQPEQLRFCCVYGPSTSDFAPKH